MLRIQGKMKDFFKDKIDLQDVQPDNKEDTFLTRSLAAFALVMTCGLDYNVAAANVTDGYHDIGIDALYKDDMQNKLVLVQSKWRKKGTGSISQSESYSFIDGIKRIINLDLVGCNSKLKKKELEISDALQNTDYHIEIIFCHTGNQKISSYAKRAIDKLLKDTNDCDELVKFTEISQQNIYEYLANNGKSNDITLDDVCLSNWGMLEEPFRSYYGIIDAATIGKWYITYGNRLFAKNIRYYKGSTDVNLGIKDIITTQPDKFVYFNNGIKLLCKKITKKAIHSTGRDIGLFTLEGVSLVNGAQTTGVIGSIYSDSNDLLKSAKIFIQIIDIGELDDTQVAQITKFSNTQNRIEAKDFVSLDPEQERLRMELNLSGIQYLYKTGSQLTDFSKQISLDEAIISKACSLSDISIVAQVKGNIGSLTENIDKKPYKLIFNHETNSFALYNGIQILRLVDEYIKKYEITATGRKRLVLIHGNRCLLYLIINKLKKIKKYDSEYLDRNEIIHQLDKLFIDYWERIFAVMQQHFSDTYPAHIFKNAGRLRNLLALINI